MIYLCTDNEAYMNTGIQRSSSTPFGASTTTSPAGRVKPGQMTWKKNMAAIAAAHNIPYVATACPSYPMDFIEKVKRAAETPGPAYLHVLSVCPTGWRSAPEMSIRLGRLAAETGAFPLYEVIDGQYRVTVDFPKLRPLKDYVRLQGRFRHLNDDQLVEIEKHLHREYAELKEKAARASIPAKAEKECIRCGRCVRICDDVVGAHAIEMVKVDDKKKEPRPRNEAKDCIACGACVVACPVDVIGMEEKNGERTIKRWKRTVKLQGCKSCGDLFAPQFQLEKFKEKAGVAEDFFDLCYDCRK
jgi:formate hydrogenlyase subunit 6/NADH:ubiquinone oxidoreductase subunit I